jgi:hypothetical protein
MKGKAVAFGIGVLLGVLGIGVVPLWCTLLPVWASLSTVSSLTRLHFPDSAVLLGSSYSCWQERVLQAKVSVGDADLATFLSQLPAMADDFGVRWTEEDPEALVWRPMGGRVRHVISRAYLQTPASGRRQGELTVVVGSSTGRRTLVYLDWTQRWAPSD